MQPVRGNAQWTRVQQAARAAARAEARRWGVELSREDTDDVVMNAVAHAMTGLGEEAALIASARRHVRSALRQRRGGRKREVTCGSVETFKGALPPGGGPFASGAMRRGRRLPALAARELARRLEVHESRHLTWAISSGALFRERKHERALYGCLFDDIARYRRRALTISQREAWVDALVAFREREIAVRCDECAPGSRWIICKHTLPVFQDGNRISGADLRRRGRKKSRTNLLFKFGTSERLFRRDVPFENHSSNYLVQDAAARLVTEALRIAELNPDIKHTRKRQEDRALTRTIKAFLKRWGRGPNGERCERVSKRWRAPGARRRRPAKQD